MLEKISFKHITLDDKKNIRAITDKFDSYSDFNFVSMFTWGFNNTTSIAFIGSNLAIRLRDYNDNKRQVYSVLGDDNVDRAIDVIFKILRPDSLELVPETVAKKVVKKYRVSHDRDNDDYIYDLKHIVEMDGSKYRKLRRQLSNFKSKNNFVPEFKEIRNLSEYDVTSILDLTRKWRKIRGKGRDASIEYLAIRHALHKYKQLNIQIWGVYALNNLIAYSITERLNKSFIIHFEKANTDIAGLGSYLKHKTCEELYKQGCRTMNYEQDLGIMGLREFKMSLGPSKFLKKYTITPFVNVEQS